MDFKKWVKSIQTAGYNGARTVFIFHKYIFTGYIGSALGGYTYDIMGFENSTLVVIAMQILALMAIFGLICSPKTTRPANDDGEKQTLLRPNCQKSDRNANYHSFEVLV